MSFADFTTVPTIDIPGLGTMTYTTVQALRDGDYQTAFDMMTEHASLYSDAHPGFVTALKVASLAGGAAGLYTFAPSIIAAFGTSGSLQGMTASQLALAPPASLQLGTALGGGGSSAAMLFGATMVARDTLRLGHPAEYSTTHFQAYQDQRARWCRLEDAELAHRAKGTRVHESAEVDEERVIYPFDSTNPWVHYEKAREELESAQKAKLPEAEIKRLRDKARETYRNSHIPNQHPHTGNAHQGSFSDWFVQGESAYWVDTFQYRAEEGHVRREESHGSKFMVGVDSERDAPYQHPGLAKGMADEISRREDLAGMAGKLTKAHHEALSELMDQEEEDLDASLEDDIWFAIDGTILNQRGLPDTAENRARLKADGEIDALRESVLANWGKDTVRDLAADARQSGMGLKAEFDAGEFTGYQGLAPRKRPPEGFYKGKEDDLYSMEEGQ